MEKERVPVKIWSMGSDPGYVPSSGWQHAIVVPADKIPVGAANNSKALFDFACSAEQEVWAARVLTTKNLIDCEPYESRHGACSYSGHTGLVEVPEGHTLIVFSYEDVSTADSARSSAKIVGGKEALADFYRQRAELYTRMAKCLDLSTQNHTGIP
jgi:hypothetical protein